MLLSETVQPWNNVQSILATAPHWSACLTAYAAHFLRFDTLRFGFNLQYLDTPAPLPPVPDELPDYASAALAKIPNSYRGNAVNIFLNVARRGEKCPFFALKRVYSELYRLRGYHIEQGNEAGFVAYNTAMEVLCGDDAARATGYTVALWAIAKMERGAKH